MRGEQFSSSVKLIPIQGSPPLARGTGVTALCLYHHAGITPACAGNSGCSADVTPGRWDHPRLRGEQQHWQWILEIIIGSPPLARGTAAEGVRD